MSRSEDQVEEATRGGQWRICGLFAVAVLAAVALVFIAATADSLRSGSFEAMTGAALQLMFVGIVLGLAMSPFFVFAAQRKHAGAAFGAIYGPVALAVIASGVLGGQAMGGHVAVGVVFLLACILVDRFLPNVREEEAQRHEGT